MNDGVFDDSNYKGLVSSLQNHQQCVRFLQQKGIIHTNRVCKGGHDMKLQFRRNGNIYWACWHDECCQNIGVRKDTWLFPSRLPLLDIILFVYAWCHEWTTIKWCDRELDISHGSVMVWSNYLREICALKLLNNCKRIGGVNTSVKVDESVFIRRKYEVGPKQQCVVGGICRETKEVFLQLIPDRKKETILAVIEEYVLPGTKVYTNDCKEYQELYNLGYKHYNMDYSLKFLNTTKCAHSQTMESMWKSEKEKTNRESGTRKDMIEFLWRQSLRGNEPFAEIWKDIAELFPPT